MADVRTLYAEVKALREEARKRLSTSPLPSPICMTYCSGHIIATTASRFASCC